jgi:site-specific DNA recombinase
LSTHARRGQRQCQSPPAVYRRVSREEQIEGYSLDAQTRAIRAYCDVRGWQIIKEYSDEGRSARTDDLRKRPSFAAMLADAAEGLFDVIVVHKVDRFARNLRVLLTVLHQLEGCRVSFASVTEDLDYTTSQGRFFLHMLGSVAQWFSDNLSFERKKGKNERKAQGLYNGLLPFGSMVSSTGVPVAGTRSFCVLNWVERDGRRVVDGGRETTNFDGLQLAMRLGRDGATDRSIADALNAAGYRTSGNRGNNPFTKDSVRAILKNRFYLGELPDGDGGWIAGAHAPMLDEDLFDDVQRVRLANRTNVAKVRRSARRYSLSGLAVCGYCGGHLNFHTDRDGKARVYCDQRRQARSSGCTQGAKVVDIFEKQIAAYLATFRLDDETVSQVIARYERAEAERDDGERRRREITSRLERIAELYKWGDLTRGAYQAERDQLQAERVNLRGAPNRSGLLREAAGYLRDFPAAWDAAPPDERNALARVIFDSVEIKDDRVLAATVKAEAAPFFATFGQQETPAGGPGCQVETEKYLSGGSDGDCSRRFQRSPRSTLHRSRPTP